MADLSAGDDDWPFEMPPALLAVFRKLTSARKNRPKKFRRRLQHHVVNAVAAISKGSNPTDDLPPQLLSLLGEFCRLMTHRAYRIPQRLMPRSQDPELLRYLSWPDEHFQSKFRLSKHLFYFILEAIEGQLSPTKEAAKHIYNQAILVSPQRKLLIALWFLTHGGEWSQVAVAGSVGDSTARKYVKQASQLALC